MRCKVDANQTAVVKVARQLGATVESLATIGRGCPDLLLGYRGKNYLVEVKDGTKSPSRRKLLEAQERWHVSWNGNVVTVTSTHDLIEFLLHEAALA